jgi:hypothetical protein
MDEFKKVIPTSWPGELELWCWPSNVFSNLWVLRYEVWMKLEDYNSY